MNKIIVTTYQQGHVKLFTRVGQLVAKAKKVPARKGWLLTIPGHRWEVTPDMPTNRFNLIPGATKITSTDCKFFQTFPECRREVTNIRGNA